MNTIKILTFIAGFTIFLLLSSFLLNYYVDKNIVGATTIYTNLEIGEEIGFKLDSDALYFGTIRQAGHSKRTINLNNNEHNLIIRIKGNISEFVYVENDFNQEKTQINFIAISDGTKQGTFEGYITIYQVKSTKILDLILPGKKITRHQIDKSPSVNLTIV
jgi:hypothetical protein